MFCGLVDLENEEFESKIQELKPAWQEKETTYGVIHEETDIFRMVSM